MCRLRNLLYQQVICHSISGQLLSYIDFSDDFGLPDFISIEKKEPIVIGLVTCSIAAL